MLAATTDRPTEGPWSVRSLEVAAASSLLQGEEEVVVLPPSPFPPLPACLQLAAVERRALPPAFPWHHRQRRWTDYKRSVTSVVVAQCLPPPPRLARWKGRGRWGKEEEEEGWVLSLSPNRQTEERTEKETVN